MFKTLFARWMRLNSGNSYPTVVLFFLLGFGFLFLFWYFNAVVLELVFLLVALRLISVAMLLIVDLSVLPMSGVDQRKLGTGISAGSTFLIMVWRVHSPICAGLIWLMFFINLRVVIQAAVRILTDSTVLMRLMKSYKNNGFPDLGFPFVYVVVEPGLNRYYGQRFCQELSLTLKKLRITLLPLISTAIHDKPIAFQKWVVAQADAIVVIRRPPPARSIAFEEMLFEYWSTCMGSMFILYMDPEKLKGTFVSEYIEPKELRARFVSDANLFEELKTQPTEELARSYDGLSSSAVKLVERLQSTVTPISESDSRLPTDLRGLSAELAQNGLPPIANCYLRFRLAQSEVERYLCLLDCVEVLVKISTIVLLSGAWEHDESRVTPLADKLERPSLGHWIEMLRTLVGYDWEEELHQSIVGFWKTPLSQTPAQLIDDTKGAGLAWKDRVPRSHLEWLNWFVWLRNVTRGHGAIEEDSAGKLWHGFHETLLRMVQGLKDLVLLSTLESYGAEGPLHTFTGWQRGIPSVDEKSRSDISNTCLALSSSLLRTEHMFLYPLAINHSGVLLLWNSVRGKAIEYIDYGSGQLTQVVYLNTSPYELWRQAIFQLASNE